MLATRSFPFIVALASLFFIPPARVLAQKADSDGKDVRAITDRVAEALGGREHLMEIRSYYFQETIEIPGQTGVIEEWLKATGEHSAATDLSPLMKTRVVFNGHSGWVVDDKGKVHELNPNQIRNQILSRFIDTYSYLLPNRIPGTVSSLGEDETHNYYVLRFAPTGGATALCYVGRNSFLPARIERTVGDRTIITAFEDYRLVDGVRIPFTTRQTDNKNDGNRNIVRISAAKLNATVDEAVFEKPAEIKYFKFENGMSATGIPLVYSPFCLLLRVSVNNSPPALFILDSGAGGTLLDADYAASLGLKQDGSVNVIGSGEVSRAGYLRNVTLGLQGMKFQIGTVMSTPLTELRNSSGLDIKGMLGGDFIRNFVVDIDYQKRMLNLFDPDDYQYKGAGRPLEIRVEGNTALTRGSLLMSGRNPIEGLFMIDTGADEPIFITRVFNESQKLIRPDNGSKKISSAGIAAKSNNLILQLDAFQLGDFTIKRPTASIFLDAEGIAANEDIAGGVGLGLLKRFRVIFDYSHQAMYLEPNSHFMDSFEQDLSGLDWNEPTPGRGSLLVQSVEEGSPAALAGLKKGDELIEINGKPVSTFQSEEIEELFKKRAVYQIRFKRDGVLATTKLDLSRPV